MNPLNLLKNKSVGDITAIEKVKSLLKPKGQFLITVPFDPMREDINEDVIVHYEKGISFERIYTNKSKYRLTKGFKVLNVNFYDTKYSGHGVLCLNLQKEI